MAVQLEAPSLLHPVAGVELATAATASRYQGRDDLLLISLCEGSTVAGVFTQNRYCAAPVIVAKQNMQEADTRALLVNAGNANAGTGSLGLANAQASCQAVAASLNLEPQQILPFSTGVIGEQLDMDKLKTGIEMLPSRLESANWLQAANAIITTDTVAKGFSEVVHIDGHAITITGIAKGSGMICPNMATMLAYVTTDASIDRELLQDLVSRANQMSFNRITVDGDTSTNDALIVAATGQTELAPLESGSVQAEQFYAALENVLVHLATSIIRDGEGATKFVKVVVASAAANSDARAIAYSVAHSPLVKTALYACDPNWGRILAAVGKAEVAHLDLQKVDIRINDLDLIVDGEPAADYAEALGKAEFEKAEIEITIDLNLGAHQHYLWFSDLSHDYVSINADYRS